MAALRPIVTVLAALGLAVALGACGKPAGERAVRPSSPSSSSPPLPRHPSHPLPPAGPSGAPVHVTLEEWAVVPSFSSTPAGKVTFEVQNQGSHPHELYVVSTADRSGQLPTTDDIADLDRAGRVIGSVGPFPPGETKRLDVVLPPGHYVLLCNVVRHYERGMHADFTAR